MTLGNRIHALRTARNLSQEYLAEQMGVSRQAVYKWEKDLSRPDTDNLIRLSLSMVREKCPCHCAEHRLRRIHAGMDHPAVPVLPCGAGQIGLAPCFSFPTVVEWQ